MDPEETSVSSFSDVLIGVDNLFITMTYEELCEEELLIDYDENTSATILEKSEDSLVSLENLQHSKSAFAALILFLMQGELIYSLSRNLE